ncbi:MAG: MATE family efflux transporter [Candidatus Saganbacteria bacterium]|nr:MATE family efflux transporter [Candidatus Saganbacteria bacterium]
MFKRMVKTFTTKRDLTTGSISKNIWFLAVPMMVSNVLQTALSIIDMIWVGRLGADALAAVAMCSSVIFVVMSVFMGIGAGVMAMVARGAGKKDYKEASYAATQSFVLGAFASILLGIIGFFFSRQFLLVIGAGEHLANLGTPFLEITMICSVVFIFLGLSNIVLQAAGDAFTPMVVMVIVTLLNIVLAPFLIFGIGPFPRLEIAGAALATVIVQLIGVLISFEVLFRGRSHLKMHLHNLIPDYGVMGKMIGIGIPAAVQLALRSIMGVFFMWIVAAFGVAAIAAYGVGLRLNMIVIMPGFGFANAAATLVGQNLGAHDPKRASQSAWLAAIYYMIVMLVLGLAFIIFAPYWILIFNNDPEVVRMGADFMRITSTTFIFVALGLVLGRAQNGAGDTMVPLIINIVALWIVQVPLALIFAYAMGMGIMGVWYAIAIAPVVGGLLSVYFFQRGGWQHKRI